VKVEAENEDQARARLLLIIQNLNNPQISLSTLLDTKCAKPVKGITQKTVRGITYVWVGAKSVDGWMEQKTYLNATKGPR